MRTYLRCPAENCQELVNVLESAVAVQAVKDQADQAYVVQRAGCQCQLSELRIAQTVQRIKLQGTKSTTTFVRTTCLHKSGNGCIARRATHAGKALVEHEQVFVIHVDGELAKALLKPSAEAAGVGPTARP